VSLTHPRPDPPPGRARASRLGRWYDPRGPRRGDVGPSGCLLHCRPRPRRSPRSGV